MVNTDLGINHFLDIHEPFHPDLRGMSAIHFQRSMLVVLERKSGLPKESEAVPIAIAFSNLARFKFLSE
jgi:hypothetical protein